MNMLLEEFKSYSVWHFRPFFLAVFTLHEPKKVTWSKTSETNQLVKGLVLTILQFHAN